MGALLAKIADIVWGIFDRSWKGRSRVNRAAAGALLHLRGVRNAPAGDSKEYRDEKYLLGVKLKKLTAAAGESPGKFSEELRIALLVQDAVVIRGERYVDEYIAQLEHIVSSDS
jgi:hypothetical protein